MTGIDDVPTWALIALPIGIVAIALATRGGGGGSGVGAVTAYKATPSDPGLVALSTSEVGARSSAFALLANVVGAEELAKITATRDTTITTIQAGVQNQRTEAERQAALAHETTSQLVGKYNSDAATAINLANVNGAATIARTNAAASTSQAHIRAKTALGDQITGIVKTGLGFVAKLFGG